MNMDEAILKAFPLLPVPKSGLLPAAPNFGTRYLAAADGLWREITLPWGTFRNQVARSHLPLPYGNVEAVVDLRCGDIPPSVIRECIAHARHECPNEAAGVFLWHADTGEWRYQRRNVYSVSGSHIRYEEVRPAEGEHLVVDVHSHGLHPAFFSAEDNADDAGAMKFCLVLGNLRDVQPTSCMRLCMSGLVLDGVRLGVRGTLELP